MATNKIDFACAMEGQIVGDFLSDAQAALAAFLPKMRGYVCFISDEDSRKLLGILNKFAEKALETKRSSHKTPMKKLEQMNIEDLMKHVQKEKLLIDLVEAEPGTAVKSVKSKKATTRGGGGEKKEPRGALERRKEKEDEKEVVDVDQEEIVAPRKRGRPPTKQKPVRGKAQKDATPAVDQQRDQVKPFKKRPAVDSKNEQREKKKQQQQHEEDKQKEKDQDQERVAWDEDKVSRC